jgi:hypothetical protein
MSDMLSLLTTYMVVVAFTEFVSSCLAPYLGFTMSDRLRLDMLVTGMLGLMDFSLGCFVTMSLVDLLVSLRNGLSMGVKGLLRNGLTMSVSFLSGNGLSMGVKGLLRNGLSMGVSFLSGNGLAVSVKGLLRNGLTMGVSFLRGNSLGFFAVSVKGLLNGLTMSVSFLRGNGLGVSGLVRNMLNLASLRAATAVGSDRGTLTSLRTASMSTSSSMDCFVRDMGNLSLGCTTICSGSFALSKSGSEDKKKNCCFVHFFDLKLDKVSSFK